MTLIVRCGAEKKCWQAQLLTLSHRMNGTGTVQKEKAIEKINSWNLYYVFIVHMLLIDIVVLFEFLWPYSVMQQHPKLRSCMCYL